MNVRGELAAGAATAIWGRRTEESIKKKIRLFTYPLIYQRLPLLTDVTDQLHELSLRSSRSPYCHCEHTP